MMTFSKSLPLFLLAQSVSAAVNLDTFLNLETLRQSNSGDVETVMMFRAWADTHDKEYNTEDEARGRFQTWMENHGTLSPHPISY